MPATAPRFTVHDTLATTASALITNGQRSRRYQILDSSPGPNDDRVYDELSSKQAATATARDLNAGLYGPLNAEEQS